MTCEGEKAPAKLMATTIYVRQGGKWRWTNYQETALQWVSICLRGAERAERHTRRSNEPGHAPGFLFLRDGGRYSCRHAA